MKKKFVNGLDKDWLSSAKIKRRPIKVGDKCYPSVCDAAGMLGLNQASLRYHYKKYGHYKGKKIEYV